MTDGASTDRTLRMECAVEHMKRQLGTTLSLADLATSVPFSRFHFLRIFREVTGLTPGRFLAALRMAEARRLLLHSSLTVGAIGPQVGYTSVGTFTTQFTRLVGVAPEQFRKLVRTVAHHPPRAVLPGRVPGDGPVIRPAYWRAGDRMVVAWRAASGDTSMEHCIAAEPGSVSVPLPRDGRRYQVRILLLAAGARVTESLVDQRAGSYLTGTVGRMLTAGSRNSEPMRVTPRYPRPIDPPLLAAAPLAQMCGWPGMLERSA